jgi:hypothetical protein
MELENLELQNRIEADAAEQRKREAAGRKRAESKYAEILARANAPRPSDSLRIFGLGRQIGLTEADIRGDLNAISERAGLEAKLLDREEIEAGQEQVEIELGRLMEEIRAVFLTMVKEMRPQTVEIALWAVLSCSSIEWGILGMKIREQASQLGNRQTEARAELARKMEASRKAWARLSEMRPQFPRVFNGE